MGSIERRFERLTKLSAEDLEDLRVDLTEQFESADTADNIELMETSLRDLQRLNDFESLREEFAPAAVAEVEPVVEEVVAEPVVEAVTEPVVTEPVVEPVAEPVAKVVEPVVETPVVEPVADEAAAAAVVAEAENIIVSEAEAVSNTEESEVVAMAASVVEPDAADEGTVEPLVASVPISPRAGADIAGITAGAVFSDINQVNQAMVAKINSIRGSHGGDGEKRTVVSVHADIPESRQLSNTNTLQNMEIIDRVTSPQALVASGGYCAPLPVNYDIFGVGSNIRPVRDSLPTFGATRGGIRFLAPPVLGAYTGAISLWTAANDANPTSPTTKPNLKVTCATEQTATTDAITLSLTFGNLMSRAFPELVQRHNQLALIQQARFAERTLLNKIGAASTQVTSAYSAGTGRDFMVSISRAAAAYRNQHRVPRGVMLRAIAPEWVLDAIREDIANNMYVEDLAAADATISSWLAARNINITWHMDDTFTAQGTGALNDFPATITWWLFAEGTFLFLDGGTLDLGVVRDANLVGTNDYLTFVETFEGLAKVGIQSLQITTTTGVGPNSGQGGSKDTVTHANQVETVTIGGSATGGTFTLTYAGQTTATIAFGAAASAVQSALVALSTIGAGNVAVTGSAGGPWTVTFQGTLGGQALAPLTGSAAGLTGGTPTLTIATTTTGY
jgi:hypothetical protein